MRHAAVRTLTTMALASTLVGLTADSASADRWWGADRPADVRQSSYSPEPPPCGTFSAVTTPRDASTDIVGLSVRHEGDTVEVRAGQGLLLNGQLLDEAYVLEKPHYNWGPEVVPAGSLCVLGDNRNNSFDSHYWGFLKANRVIGAPAAVIWPPKRMRRL